MIELCKSFVENGRPSAYLRWLCVRPLSHFDTYFCYVDTFLDIQFSKIHSSASFLLNFAQLHILGQLNDCVTSITLFCVIEFIPIHSRPIFLHTFFFWGRRWSIKMLTHQKIIKLLKILFCLFFNF